jgi:hypothetical protein
VTKKTVASSRTASMDKVNCHETQTTIFSTGFGTSALHNGKDDSPTEKVSLHLTLLKKISASCYAIRKTAQKE